MLIIIIPFEKPKIEVHIFDRATLSGFCYYEVYNKKQVLWLKIKNSYFLWRKSSYKNICFIKAKCLLKEQFRGNKKYFS